MEDSGHFDDKDNPKFKKIGTKRIWGGEMGLYADVQDVGSFEEYILETVAGRFQRILARLGCKVSLGEFKPDKPGCGFNHYYLAWCPVHKKHFVNYYQHEDLALDCPDCSKDLFSSSRARDDTQNNEPIGRPRKPERNLRLVKSDRRKS